MHSADFLLNPIPSHSIACSCTKKVCTACCLVWGTYLEASKGKKKWLYLASWKAYRLTVDLHQPLWWHMSEKRKGVGRFWKEGIRHGCTLLPDPSPLSPICPQVPICLITAPPCPSTSPTGYMDHSDCIHKIAGADPRAAQKRHFAHTKMHSAHCWRPLYNSGLVSSWHTEDDGLGASVLYKQLL